jgi:glycosyltransferase involved in cell wall biosynthesis
MRIIYLCADPGIPLLGGKGASVHVRNVTEALSRMGHQVALACAKVGAGNPAPLVEHVVELETCAAAREEQLYDLMRSHRADVVIERYSLASGPGRRASLSAGLPLVLEVNAPLVLEAARHRGLGNVAEWLDFEREVFASSDAIGVVSRALATYVLTSAPQIPVRWIPNGVDPGRFEQAVPADLGLPAWTVAVGFAGSMKAWHGVLDLIDALSQPAIGQAARLVLIGSGPQATAVKERIVARGLGDRVLTLGQVAHSRIPSLFAALDIGVAPYLPEEHFYFSPLKVLEYLAAGLPVVCPALGDLPELVAGAGALYRAGDVEDLARAIASLVDDPLRCRALAPAARAVSQRWTWDANAEAYAQLAAATSTSRDETAVKSSFLGRQEMAR